MTNFIERIQDIRMNVHHCKDELNKAVLSTIKGIDIIANRKAILTIIENMNGFVSGSKTDKRIDEKRLEIVKKDIELFKELSEIMMKVYARNI